MNDKFLRRVISQEYRLVQRCIDFDTAWNNGFDGDNIF